MISVKCKHYKQKFLMQEADKHAKFVMQVNRDEPVPRLVSINELTNHTTNIQNRINNKYNRTGMKIKSVDKPYRTFSNNFSNYNPNINDHSLTQSNESKLFNLSQSQAIKANTTILSNDPVNYNAQQMAPSSSVYTTIRKQLPITQPRNYRLEVIQLQKSLEVEKQEKLQLQSIIKQLTVKSEKLKQVNQHIVQRLKDIEKNFVQEKIAQENELEQRVRKAVGQAYADVQHYVRGQIQTVMQKLKGQKMTPLLEKKLELFMESMLQINQNTVQMSKLSKKRNSLLANSRNGLSLSQQQKEYRSNNKSTQKQNQLRTSFISNRPRKISILDEFITNNNDSKDMLIERSVQSKRKKQQPTSPERSMRKLINNAYISSSNRRQEQSPSHITIQPQASISYPPNDYSTILKQLQNQQMSYYNNRNNQEELEIDNSGQFVLSNAFRSNQIDQNRYTKDMRRKNIMGDSFVQRKKFYETANYDDSNFKVKEYTPNKRKKIFDNVDKNRSKSKNNNQSAYY